MARTSGKRRYGDPRKAAQAEERVDRDKRPARELSSWFIGLAWLVFFVLWAVVGSLLVAAIVLGVMLSAGMALRRAS